MSKSNEGDSQTSFSIPDDLLRLILENLFELPEYRYSPKSKFKLLTLSRHVRSWLEPLLYRDMQLDDENFSLLKSRPEFMSSYLETCYARDLTATPVIVLLNLCTTLTRLTLNYHFTMETAAPLLQHEFATSLRHLSIIISMKGALRRTGTSPHPWSSPLFRSLTHLDIALRLPAGTGINTGGEAFMKPLRALTNITHLALDCSPLITENPRNVDNIAPYFPPSLKMALIFVMHTYARKKIGYKWLLEKCDPRIAFYTESDKGHEELLSDVRPLMMKADDTALRTRRPQRDAWVMGDIVLAKRRAIREDIRNGIIKLDW